MQVGQSRTSPSRPVHLIHTTTYLVLEGHGVGRVVEEAARVVQPTVRHANHLGRARQPALPQWVARSGPRAVGAGLEEEGGLLVEEPEGHGQVDHERGGQRARDVAGGGAGDGQGQVVHHVGTLPRGLHGAVSACGSAAGCVGGSGGGGRRGGVAGGPRPDAHLLRRHRGVVAAVSAAPQTASQYRRQSQGDAYPVQSVLPPRCPRLAARLALDDQRLDVQGGDGRRRRRGRGRGWLHRAGEGGVSGGAGSGGSGGRRLEGLVVRDARRDLELGGEGLGRQDVAGAGEREEIGHGLGGREGEEVAGAGG